MALAVFPKAHAARFPNYRGPFAYLPHLYLNETEPVDLGHSYVGLMPG